VDESRGGGGRFWEEGGSLDGLLEAGQARLLADGFWHSGRRKREKIKSKAKSSGKPKVDTKVAQR